MPKKPTHLHKYKKVTLGKNFVVFKCQLANCTHYMRYELAEGKLCECNRCGNPMILDKLALKLTKPHCLDCTKTKHRDVELEALADILKDRGL